MRIGFVVNQTETERAEYSTTRLAKTARSMGHEVWIMGVGDFVYDPDGSVHAVARGVPDKKYRSLDNFLAAYQDDESIERVTIDDLDIVWLRNDPAEDAAERPWASTTGILFGQLAVARGVMVLNDPANLANAINKTYFQHFPEEVRPRTCISRNVEEIKSFISDQNSKKVVIKPLQGSGGQNVFVVSEKETPNINQMIEAVIRDGYCIVQEYLPAAAKGDVRLFVMNGQPLQREGEYAAFRRVNKNGDARSNMHAGGVCERAEIDDQALQLVEMVRPKLIRDGMFLVGLDIVKDKLMEINVFSPGGLGSAELLTGVDFTVTIIEDLERKLHCRKYYSSVLDNASLASI